MRALWRHQQKLPKVLDRHSFKTTWEFQRLKTIHEDMKRISKSGIWPYTSYSPQPYQKSIPGDMSDISPEELRYLRYTSHEEEYVAYEKSLETDYKEMRRDLRMERWRSSIDDPYERRLCDRADNIMLFLETGLYISVAENLCHSKISFGSLTLPGEKFIKTIQYWFCLYTYIHPCKN